MRTPVGLYEQLLTEALRSQLGQATKLSARRTQLLASEAPDRIAFHLSKVIERTLLQVRDKERVGAGIIVGHEIVKLLTTLIGDPEVRAMFERERPADPGEVLRAILARRPDGGDEDIPSPQTPLLDTTLLTNSRGDPSVGHELRSEVPSADRVDVLMAFVLMSGLRPFLEPLREHLSRGRQVRVLTTTFTGSTEARALDALRDLGAEVRVSYDTTTTRLHAKAWLFHRDSGFSTAYIGSSNVSNSAQVTGLEWNVRVSGARNPHVIGKFAAVFESYWQSSEFRPYSPEEFQTLSVREAGSYPKVVLSPIELRAEPFQERLLEQVALARTEGRHRNLLVSATGTGKTVMAALDYARLRALLPRARLLFVAHREEILEQSRATFAYALRDPSFGEMWVGGRRPDKFECVFASIQSLAAAGYENLDAEHFDVVVIDEFHHAAAQSYQSLLNHLRPKELLGLTATPERADGLPILEWFDGRIAAELRLWDAIDQQRLVPFSYFGIYDGLDLRQVPWKRGRGYDVDGLTNLYTGNDAWARFVLQEFAKRVDDIGRVRALGFCVSIPHARFMARIFMEAGVRAVAVWSEIPDEDRRTALSDLREGRVQVIFSVDLFNEGVDIPAVDTLLLLRPTDSATLFLQQLGRGLRRNVGKLSCTVLDFVGLHHAEFRFEHRLGALLGLTRRELIDHIEQDFPFLPAGCHLELEPKAREIILEGLRGGIPSGWSTKVAALRRIAVDGRAPSLGQFLHETGLELDDVYLGERCFSDLCCDADLRIHPAGPQEAVLRRAIGRLLHVDDRTRLDGYLDLLKSDEPPVPAELDTYSRRLLRMLLASLIDKAVKMDASVKTGCDLVWGHPQVRAELVELFGVLRGRISHLPRPLASHPEAPLQVHARYTRLELLAALGVGTGAKVANWVTGARYVKEARSDILAFTLDKASGHFSPTTRYRDYAISRDLIHWESQSVVREDSETGLRYREHAGRGSHVLLFARMKSTERSFYFLGPATYVRHSGELPMAITWRLQHPLPGDIFAAFAAAVA